jgi:integrase
MKGHIRQRGPKVFETIVCLGRDASGKWKYNSKTVHGSRKVAEAVLARTLSELSLGSFVEPSKMRVPDFLEQQWLPHVKSRTSPRTYERYEQIVKQHLTKAFSPYTLSGLKPLHVQRALVTWLESGRMNGKGGLSPQTVRHHFAVLSEALSCALRWGLVARNICHAVERPHMSPRETKLLDDTSLATLLEKVRGSRLEGPVWLAALTGLRRGEILGLRWGCVNVDKQYLEVKTTLQQTSKGEVFFKGPKSVAGRRNISLPTIAIDVLRRQKTLLAADKLKCGPVYQDDDLVFAQPTGLPWKPETFSRTFALFLGRHKLPRVNFHSLRHGFATALARQGVHPRVAQQLLGHSDPRLTMAIYSHSAPDLERSAVAKVSDAISRALASGNA